MERFYVDKRSGIIAVKDRSKKYDLESMNGLHGCNKDVVAHWMGYSKEDKNGQISWNLYDWQIKKAEELCALLNKLNKSGIPINQGWGQIVNCLLNIGG